MVSNTLNLDPPELVDALIRLRQESGKTLEYRELRRPLPKDWPI